MSATSATLSLEKNRDILKSEATAFLKDMADRANELGADMNPIFLHIMLSGVLQDIDTGFLDAIEARDKARESRRCPVERQLSRADFLYDEAVS